MKHEPDGPVGEERGWHSGDDPDATPKPERGRGLESFSPTGPLGFVVGDRYNVGHDRMFEWRDAVGCLWLPGLVAILSIAIWLGQQGAPQAELAVGTVGAMVGLGVVLWRVAKGGSRPNGS